MIVTIIEITGGNDVVPRIMTMVKLDMVVEEPAAKAGVPEVSME